MVVEIANVHAIRNTYYLQKDRGLYMGPIVYGLDQSPTTDRLVGR